MYFFISIPRKNETTFSGQQMDSIISYNIMFVGPLCFSLSSLLYLYCAGRCFTVRVTPYEVHPVSGWFFMVGVHMCGRFSFGLLLLLHFLIYIVADLSLTLLPARNLVYWFDHPDSISGMIIFTKYFLVINMNIFQLIYFKNVFS